MAALLHVIMLAVVYRLHCFQTCYQQEGHCCKAMEGHWRGIGGALEGHCCKGIMEGYMCVCMTAAGAGELEWAPRCTVPS
jgi:hypothetical protein